LSKHRTACGATLTCLLGSKLQQYVICRYGLSVVHCGDKLKLASFLWGLLTGHRQFRESV